MTASPRVRWVVLGLLVAVAVGSLVATGLVFATKSAGDDFGDRVASLREDEAPDSDEVATREQLLALSREFVTRFNTYSPEMLDDEGHLPDYAAIADLMTPKFADVFTKNVGYAEQTVSQLGATRTATVYGVGVAAQDVDSARVLVAGTVELSYPARDRGGKGDDGAQPGDEEPRISSGPQRFRYEVSLVEVDGRWLVDDLDDVDDGLPPFSQPSIPEQPTDAPAPSGSTGPAEPTEGATTP